MDETNSRTNRNQYRSQSVEQSRTFSHLQQAGNGSKSHLEIPIVAWKMEPYEGLPFLSERLKRTCSFPDSAEDTRKLLLPPPPLPLKFERSGRSNNQP
ncbi:hypothetical protein TNIN_237221 [Trichonephila inaurata madagascariensis]|uniref:Uncharacterized protein n=1 Tax=Trichonephila inaurata madagascariensis TaxID=2747483 RepID=A0A8X6X5S2_9ARAC|nr:hypothetical protein TNIN_237221 [Trichonephila inaurata madagascariensis]